MTRRHVIAVGVALLSMLVVLVPPLWVRATGDEVTLEIRPVDPLSLFRGNRRSRSLPSSSAGHQEHCHYDENCQNYTYSLHHRPLQAKIRPSIPCLTGTDNTTPPPAGHY